MCVYCLLLHLSPRIPRALLTESPRQLVGVAHTFACQPPFSVLALPRLGTREEPNRASAPGGCSHRDGPYAAGAARPPEVCEPLAEVETACVHRAPLRLSTVGSDEKSYWPNASVAVRTFLLRHRSVSIAFTSLASTPPGARSTQGLPLQPPPPPDAPHLAAPTRPNHPPHTPK